MTTDRLHVEVHPGSGPHALLVHGALASRALWHGNLDALATVCRPVVVELWGHGLSPSPADAGRYRHEAYIDEFERLRHDLGAERWFTIGQSMGAGLTLRYGVAHPDRVLAQVVTNSTAAFAPSEGWVERHRKGSSRLVAKIRDEGLEFLRDHALNPARSRRIPEPTRTALADAFDEHGPAGVASSLEITTGRLPLGQRLSEVSVPTLLTAGMDETAFADLLPRARLVPGIEIAEIQAAHAVNAQAPEAWNDAVTDFLARHPPTDDDASR